MYSNYLAGIFKLKNLNFTYHLSVFPQDIVLKAMARLVFLIREKEFFRFCCYVVVWHRNNIIETQCVHVFYHFLLNTLFCPCMFQINYSIKR